MHSKLTAAAAANLLAPTPLYRKEATKAILSIIAFIIVYFVLFALSLALALLCIYGGAMIIILKPTFITLALGVGIMSTGVMVFIFLIKFLFASYKSDESDSIEIFEHDHPKLFQSIRSLATSIGTPMPRKVFISPDVNACVFYNSSFWSMFLPVRKNLKIGLGLVNAVNVSELEAVIAHEFGHFSQRSMKIGSWSYQVNRIIYDMLFNNNRFVDRLVTFTSAHGILQLFGWITIKIIQGIQWLLRQMYSVVNKSYLGLSRQMEFHADLVAASYCGTNNIIGALRQLRFADECYDEAMNACNKAWAKKQVVADFYAAHELVLQKMGEKRQFSFSGPIPVVGEINESSSRINFKDQWSSHPTIIERSEYLDPFGLHSDVDSTPASNLLHDPVALKATITDKIYRNIPKEEVQDVLKGNAIEQLVKEELQQQEFPAMFKGYYDNRQLEIFDVDEVLKESNTSSSFEEILDEEKASLPKKINLLRGDIYLLQAIADGRIDTLSFDFDGKKYKKSEAETVLEQLKEELRSMEEQLKKQDEDLFRYFHAKAGGEKANELKDNYRLYFEMIAASQKFNETIIAIETLMAPLYDGLNSIESINDIIGKFKNDHEPALKELLKTWKPNFVLEPELVTSIDHFLEKDYRYFYEDSFFDNELTELNTLMTDALHAIYKTIKGVFVEITEEQAEIHQQTRVAKLELA